MGDEFQRAPEQRSDRDRLLQLVVNLGEGSVDDFADLCLKVNRILIPNIDNHIGSFIDRDVFKEKYGDEIKKLMDKSREFVDVVITLSDGQHRLVFELDRELPENNSLNLSQSQLKPDVNVLKRWEEMGASHG